MMNIFHGYKQNEKAEIKIQPLKKISQIWVHHPGFPYEQQYILQDNITNFRVVYAIAIKNNDISTINSFTLIPEALRVGRDLRYPESIKWYINDGTHVKFSGNNYTIMNVIISRENSWSVYCIYGQE